MATRKSRKGLAAVPAEAPQVKQGPPRRFIGSELRLHRDGVWRDLKSGGRVLLRPISSAYMNRVAEMQIEAVKKHNESLPDDSKARLTMGSDLPVAIRERIRNAVAIGSGRPDECHSNTVLDWEGFFYDPPVDEDGNPTGEAEEIVSRHPDGTIHTENGLLLLSVPSVDMEITQALFAVAGEEQKTRERLKGNS